METTLKIAYINADAGRQRQELVRYVENQKSDIMFFSEVSHLRSPLQKALVYIDETGHPVVLDSHNLLTDRLNIGYEHRFDAAGEVTWNCLRTKDTYHNVGFGCSLFHRRHGQFARFNWGAELINTGYEDSPPQLLQWICVIFKGQRYLIAHFGGVLIADNRKGDCPERTLQSRLVNVNLQALMMRNKAKYLILGGNLNLDPNTDALRRLEGWGSNSPQLRNLIREYGKEGTKTSLHPHPEEGPHFGDYVLVSQEVNVTSFTVNTAAQVSESAPMIVSVS